MVKRGALLVIAGLVLVTNVFAAPIVKPTPGFITDYAADGTKLGTTYFDANGNITSTYTPDPTKPPKSYGNIYTVQSDGKHKITARNFYKPDGSIGNYTLYSYSSEAVLSDATNYTFMGMYTPNPAVPAQRIDVVTRKVRYLAVNGQNKESVVEIFTPFRDPKLIGGSGWTSRRASRTSYEYSNEGVLLSSNISTFDPESGAITRTTHNNFIHIGSNQLVSMSDVVNFVDGNALNQTVTETEYNSSGVVEKREIEYIDLLNAAKSYHRTLFYDESGQLTHSHKIIPDGTVYTMDANNIVMRVDYVDGSHLEYLYNHGDAKVDEIKKYDALDQLVSVQVNEYDAGRNQLMGSVKTVKDATFQFNEFIYYYNSEGKNTRVVKFAPDGSMVSDLYYDWQDGVLVGRTLINFYKDYAGSPYTITKTYNAQYLLTDTVKTGREGRVLYAIHTVYDSVGHKVSSEKTINKYTPIGLKETIRYQMDAQDRIVAVDDHRGHGVYIYNGNGTINKIDFGQGSSEEYVYAGDGKLDTITFKSAGTTIFTEKYNYNASTGKLANSVKIYADSGQGVEKVQSFYASSGKISSQKIFLNNVLQETKVFRYDSLGEVSGYTLTTSDGKSVEVDASGFTIKSASFVDPKVIGEIVYKQTTEEKAAPDTGSSYTFSPNLAEPVDKNLTK